MREGCCLLLTQQLLSNLHSCLAAACLLTPAGRWCTCRNATKQWLLGEALLVSPVITPDTTVIQPHFTKGTW